MSHAYLVGDLILLTAWLFLFLYRKDLRNKMLGMSLLVAPLGPLSEFFYLRDYWHPQLLFGLHIGIEDVLFAFCVGGIAGVIYEEIFGERYSKRRVVGHRHVMLAAAAFLLAWMVLGCLVLHYNSIYVSVSAFLIISVAMLYARHDLATAAVCSGMLMGG